MAGRSARAKTLVPEGTQGLGTLTKQPGAEAWSGENECGGGQWRADGGTKTPGNVPVLGRGASCYFSGSSTRTRAMCAQALSLSNRTCSSYSVLCCLPGQKKERISFNPTLIYYS